MNKVILFFASIKNAIIHVDSEAGAEKVFADELSVNSEVLGYEYVPFDEFGDTRD